jgi:P27 family predicted phage terminase small subunit
VSGARGRLSMPDNVRELRGNPGKRKSPPNSTERFVAAVPNPPVKLSREALAEWKRITPELGRTKVLSMGDRALLTTYCETWSSTRALTRAQIAAITAVAQLTEPLEILAGWEKVTRIEGAINAKVRLMLPMMQQLLLTPVSRLRTPPPKEDDGRPAGLD